MLLFQNKIKCYCYKLQMLLNKRGVFQSQGNTFQGNLLQCKIELDAVVATTVVVGALVVSEGKVLSRAV